MWHITLRSAWVRSQPEHRTCRYALYEPLNILWQAYAGKLLQSPNLEDLLQVRIQNEAGTGPVHALHDLLFALQ